jgi:hypothetical protein
MDRKAVDGKSDACVALKAIAILLKSTAVANGESEVTKAAAGIWLGILTNEVQAAAASIAEFERVIAQLSAERDSLLAVLETLRVLAAEYSPEEVCAAVKSLEMSFEGEVSP